MPGSARKKGQRLADRTTLAAMLCRGHTRAEMADAVGMSLPTVYRELAALQAEWRSRAAADFAASRAERDAELAAVWEEAWSAYRDGKAAGRPDARLLRVVLAATEARVRLSGLDVTPADTGGADWMQPIIYIPHNARDGPELVGARALTQEEREQGIDASETDIQPADAAG